MTTGIMQPYYFPYIGYWQLMNRADRYVIYDDAAFIKGGWIARNRILINGVPSFINVPLSGAGSGRPIREIRADITPRSVRKTRTKLECAYRRAPYYGEVYPVVARMLDAAAVQEGLADYLSVLIREMTRLLNIRAEFSRSSELSRGKELRGQDRVIEICRELNTDVYLNAIGGMHLYRAADFQAVGMELRFLRTDPISYRQFGGAFCPDLSIIDVLMFNGWEGTRALLDACDEIPGI